MYTLCIYIYIYIHTLYVHYIYTIYIHYIYTITLNEYTNDLLHMYNCGYVIHHPTVVEGGQHEPPQRVRIRGALNFSTQRGTNGEKRKSMGHLWETYGNLGENYGETMEINQILWISVEKKGI